MHSNLNRIISKILQPIPDKLYLKCIFYFTSEETIKSKKSDVF